MDKKSKYWRCVQRISAVVIGLCVLAYAGANLIYQIPYLQYAVDSGWNPAAELNVLKSVTQGRALGTEWAMNAYGEALNLLDKQESGGFEIIRSANGTLNYTDLFPFSTYDYETQAVRIQRLRKATKDNRLLFVTAIDLSTDDQADYGAIPAASYQRRSDAIIYYLQGLGVELLDARTLLSNENAHRYKTDTHWRIEDCFTVFDAMIDTLEAQGLALDPQGFYTNAQNYLTPYYAERFTGRFGQHTGIPFSGAEDFQFYLPAFPTDLALTASHYGHDKTVRGTFEDVIVNKQLLEEENDYERRMYNVYFGSDAPIRTIVNHAQPAGAKILIVGDTYMAPVVALMSLVAGETHYLWLYDNPLVEDLEAYIKAEDFDAVLIGMSSLSMGEGGYLFLGVEE